MSGRPSIELAPERFVMAGEPVGDVWSGDQHIVLTLGDSEFAVPLGAIQEVERVPAIVGVPVAPVWISGIANLRGTILTIADLGALLGLQPWVLGPEARILVVRSAEPVAVAVDGVRGMRRISPSPLIGFEESLPDRLARYITGVHRGDGGLIYALDLLRLLDDTDTLVNRTTTSSGTTLLTPA